MLREGEFTISLTKHTVNPVSGYNMCLAWILGKLRRGLNYNFQFASNKYYNQGMGLEQMGAKAQQDTAK